MSDTTTPNMDWILDFHQRKLRPRKRVLCLLITQLLANNGPMTANEIRRELMIPANKFMESVAFSSWFETCENGTKWTLTAIGRVEMFR